MVPSTVRVLGISAEIFLIFRIDFKPVHVFLMLLQLVSTSSQDIESQFLELIELSQNHIKSICTISQMSPVQFNHQSSQTLFLT